MSERPSFRLCKLLDMRTLRFIDTLVRCPSSRVNRANRLPATDVDDGVLFEALSSAACMATARKALRHVELWAVYDDDAVASALHGLAVEVFDARNPRYSASPDVAGFVATIEEMPRWFRRVAASRLSSTAAGVLASRDDPLSASASALDGEVYMFWDLLRGVFGAYPDEAQTRSSTARLRRVVDAVVRACREQLRVPNEVVQIGALHGLGHVERYWPGLAAPIVTAYVSARPDLSPLQQEYAREAILGEVL